MHRRRNIALAVLTVLLTCVAPPKCGRAAAAPETRATAAGETLHVLAAASLTEAFHELATAFHAANPLVTVEVVVGGSQALARQIVEGAPADVFASADEASMEPVRAADLLADTPAIFARNTLVIAVARGNPQHLGSLADLGRSGLTIALCAAGVPAGRYAREAFQRAGVAVPPASEEIDVRAALTKVELGEADAAVVYATDVRARRSRVDAVAIPADVNPVARYPIVTLARAAHLDAARRFVASVLSPHGRRVLAAYGFEAP